MNHADAFTAARRLLAQRDPSLPAVCDQFYVPPGGNLWHCADCDATETLHVLKALTGTCGSCEHGNDAETINEGETHCTLRGGFYGGKLMQMSARCAAWTPQVPV